MTTPSQSQTMSFSGHVCTLCGSKNRMHECPDPRQWTIHRNRRGRPRWYQRWLEAWWIVRGTWSLHRAWQDGLNHGSQWQLCSLINRRQNSQFYLTNV